MAADFILLHPCPVKQALGDGNVDAGTDRLLECLKARGRAAAVAEHHRRRGEEPAGKTITLQLYHATRGTETRQVAYEELLAQAAPLEPLEPHCRGCPANVLGRPFGCIGDVKYPIPLTTQRWLLDRIEPPGTLGGQFFLRGVADFDYTGEPLVSFRQNGLLEGATPPSRTFHVGPGNDLTLSVDQLLQGVLCVNAPLDPTHCLLVLLWLGALRFDGVGLATVDRLREAIGLTTPAERSRRVGLDLGRPHDDPAVRSMQSLLEGFFAAWVLDARLWVWA